MRTTFIPAITFGLSSGGGIRVALSGDIETVPLHIRFFWYFNIFLCFGFKRKCFSVGFGKVCIPIPFIKWCGEKQGTIFAWGLPPIRKRLFYIESGPYDTTPPQRGSISVA